MLNWPGRNSIGSAPWTGATVSVTVSEVSATRSRTWNGRGARGCPEPGRPTASLGRMDVQELEPGVLETLGDHGKEAGEEPVSLGGVGLQGGAKDLPVEVQRPSRLERTAIEGPPTGRYEPRPTDDLAGSHRLDGQTGPLGGRHLEGDLAADDQQELLRGRPL